MKHRTAPRRARSALPRRAYIKPRDDEWALIARDISPACPRIIFLPLHTDVKSGLARRQARSQNGSPRRAAPRLEFDASSRHAVIHQSTGRRQWIDIPRVSYPTLSTLGLFASSSLGYREHRSGKFPRFRFRPVDAAVNARRARGRNPRSPRAIRGTFANVPRT